MRVASATRPDQDNTILAHQERSIRDFAAKEDYTIQAVFVDINERADTPNRRALTDLFRYLQEHDVDAVLVYQKDRLGRSYDIEAYENEFRRLGAATVYTSEAYGDGWSDFAGWLAGRINRVMGEDMGAVEKKLDATQGHDTITLPRKVVAKMHDLLLEIVKD